MNYNLDLNGFIGVQEKELAYLRGEGEFWYNDTEEE